MSEKEQELENSFRDFSKLVSDHLIVRKGLAIDGITYSVEEKADYYADNLKIENGTYIFDVKTPTEIITDVKFKLHEHALKQVCFCT